MKKLICILLCVITLACCCFAAMATGVTEEDTDITIEIFQPGDVNGDRRPNKDDAALLLKYVAGWNVSIKKDPADVTGDGKIDGLDAMLLLQKFSGVPETTLK
ncbi:MAG: dockerin type I repeat-containing protein [Oscillospiraceae bacterium]|nr:dockerin type I repeat-containing protein [Oscillospiraceae bacterium]